MLVLTRTVNQDIVIDDKVTVRVLEIRGREVKIGVDAPHPIEVHRREVLDKIKREGQKKPRVPKGKSH